MSTICKLYPSVRAERTSRKSARRFFGAHGNLNTDIGVMCIAIHDVLAKLAKDSSRSGAFKQRIAVRLESEFEANMKAAQKKANGPVADERKLQKLG